MTYYLNTKNLAMIGILEDAYSIFDILVTSIQTASLKDQGYFDYLKEHSPVSVDATSQLQTFQYMNFAREAVLRKLDGWLNSNCFIFSPDAFPIHVDNEMFGHIYGQSVLNAPKHGPVCYPTFTTFLHAIEDAVYGFLSKNYFLNTGKHFCDRKVYGEHIQAVADVYRAHIAHYSVSETLLTDVIVYKCLHQVSCNLQNHKIVSIVRPVAVLSPGKRVEFPVHHCETCGKDFVGIQTLKAYSDEFGKPDLNYSFDSDGSSDFNAFPPMSELYKTGYNVRQSGMSETERRILLKGLIDQDPSSYMGICRDLGAAISRFEFIPRFYEAVKKWKSDLQYVTAYVLSTPKD